MPPSCALLGGFAIGAWDALLWQHYGNAWQSPAVIRQAQRTPRTHARTHAPAIKSTWRLGVCDVICNDAVPFRPYCAGDATRTRNVSEYMLVLALCLVRFVNVCLDNEKLGWANKTVVASISNYARQNWKSLQSEVYTGKLVITSVLPNFTR